MVSVEVVTNGSTTMTAVIFNLASIMKKLSVEIVDASRAFFQNIAWSRITIQTAYLKCCALP